jgi:hypothetical protein
MAARVGIAGTTLTVTATANNERNVITIARLNDLITIRDTSVAPEADETCTAEDDTVYCIAARIDRVSVNLGAGDDELTQSVPLPSTFISGREGADVIRVRNGAADPVVDCGTGDDFAVVDTQDAPRNCEAFDNGVPPETAITSGPPPVLNPGASGVKFEFSASESPATFNCHLDSQLFDGCTSPFTTPLLTEGEHAFGVAATDTYGNADLSEATATFVIDQTPPNTSFSFEPPDITDTRTPAFGLAASEPSVTYICQIDTIFFACDAPVVTLPALENGEHVFSAYATDAAGNFDQTPASRGFIVAASSPVPPKLAQQPIVIVLGSIVLISGRTVKMSKSGTVPVSLNCAGSQTCKGTMTLATADPVRITARKIVRLGNAKFRIKPQSKKLIRVRLNKTARKLVKRLRRVRSRATIREIDLRGNPRISSRVFTLRSK